MADTSEEAQRLAEVAGWSLYSPLTLLLDVAVWTYAGLVVIVVIGLARRRPGPGGPEEPDVSVS